MGEGGLKKNVVDSFHSIFDDLSFLNGMSGLDPSYLLLALERMGGKILYQAF